MRIKYIFIILALAGIVSIPTISYASVTYNPGTPLGEIALTGSNNDVRFDVHSVLFDESSIATGAKLIIDSTIIDSPTLNFTGAFYMSGIGWGLLQTGTYQVGLNCGASVDFSALPKICHLSGSGWSEMIGELGFSGAEYYSASGTLSGTIHSNLGNISLDGIYLPLKPNQFTIDLNNNITNHNYTLTVSGSLGYREGKWELKRTPMKDSASSNIYIGSSTGVFTNVDLSLADTYEFQITNPDGGITEITNVKILSGSPSLLLVAGDYLAKDFCTSYGETDCPDGTTLKETRIIQAQDNATMIGDGSLYYHFLLKSRDQYGNAVNTGTLQITYTTTAKSNQLDGTNTDYPTTLLENLLPYNAIIHSGTIASFTSYPVNGESTSLVIDMFAGQDIPYSFASIAPTDSTENIIRFKSIKYTTHTGVIQTLITGFDTNPLIFDPRFTVETKTSGDIFIGDEHGFEVTVTNHSAHNDITPQIYSFLSIGSNNNAAFRDFISDGTIDCQAYKQDIGLYTDMCNWARYRGEVDNSIVKVSHPSGFIFTGTYAPIIKYPIEEDVKVGNIIHYIGTDTDGGNSAVAYHGPVKNFGKSLFQISNIKILGSTNGGKEYGGVVLEGSQKAKFFDTLRQKVSLLSRNRTNYSDVDYTILSGDTTVDQSLFLNKKTVIVLGGNVTITENIARQEKPIALIALADSSGNGGVITVEDDVTDLNLSLVTDRHITTEGDYQLYINGSIFSSNTLGESASPICPYYITDPCTSTEAKKYDLEKIRSLFGKLTSTTGKTATNPLAKNYPNTGIIIEYDMRIVTNPPPGL